MSQKTLNTFSPTPFTKNNVGHKLLIPTPGSRIAVIGAGAFGGWSALYLLRHGFKVTLIDCWGAGNSRSSSGDETRVIRSTYGNNEMYFDLNVRALHLWKENEIKFNTKLFYNTGVLWFCYQEKNPTIDDSIPFSKKHAMEYQYLSASELKNKFDVVNTNDLHHAFYDRYGGYLKARESCEAVKQAFVNEGGDYVETHVRPGNIVSEKLRFISCSSGEKMEADLYLFACGAWLPSIFPHVLSNVITCSRQEVYYFGAPAEQEAPFKNFPVWIDVDGEDFYYGIPTHSNRGFKIGVDRRGSSFDPSVDDRMISPTVLEKARSFIAHRFPYLKDSPLLEGRVCPYENSPDGNFILDRHPEASNVIFLGGGSGHGFKHSPALGELVAKVLIGERKIPDLFLLSRF